MGHFQEMSPAVIRSIKRRVPEESLDERISRTNGHTQARPLLNEQVPPTSEKIHTAQIAYTTFRLDLSRLSSDSSKQECPYVLFYRYYANQNVRIDETRAHQITGWRLRKTAGLR